jgi:hypothetical protein
MILTIHAFNSSRIASAFCVESESLIFLLDKENRTEQMSVHRKVQAQAISRETVELWR